MESMKCSVHIAGIAACAGALMLSGCFDLNLDLGGDWGSGWFDPPMCPEARLADGTTQVIGTESWPPATATDFPFVSCDPAHEQCAIRALYGGGGEFIAGSHCVTNALGETLCFGWPRELSPSGAAPPNGARLDVVDVDVGASFRCFRSRDGVLRCEGYHDVFGIANDPRTDPEPGALFSWISDWVEADGVDAASIGGTMLCYVREEKTYCRGFTGGFPYPGAPTGDSLQVELTEMLGLPATQDVAVGLFSACALSVAGQVHCWGSNDGGQLGRRNDPGSATPIPIDLPPLQRLSAGAGAYAGIDFEGGVWLWGTLSSERPDELSAQSGWQLYCCPNSNGTLREGCYAPARVEGLPGRAVDVGVGREHACALLEDGRVFCWGGNGSGQLGQGDVSARPQPTQVPLGFAAEYLSVTRLGTCVSAGDALWCWGHDEQDNLHVGPADTLCEVRDPQGGLLFGSSRLAPCILEPRRVLDYPPAP